MSSTNRGSVREVSDFYATPKDFVQLFIDSYGRNLIPHGGGILEPSAGNGNVVSVIRENYPNGDILSCELREEEYENLLSEGSNRVEIGDFFEFETDEKFELIIGNPPYALAQEFIEKCLDMLSDDGKLVFLLRTAFLESKKRYQFWQDNPVSELYVLSKRPSFTGKGSDSASYSWFVWDKKITEQKIKVIM